MKNSSNGSVAGKGDVWRLIAQAVLPYVLQELQMQGLPAATYYDQHNNPLGRRKYLQLVRRGTLKGHKVGRSVLVARDDVHAYIASQRRPSTTPNGDPLEDWGLRRKGKQ